jgi:hypothetical protein
VGEKEKKEERKKGSVCGCLGNNRAGHNVVAEEWWRELEHLYNAI